MIIVGCVVDDDKLFREQAQLGLDRIAGADVWVYSLAGTIGRTANLILDHARAVPDLEAVILVRRDTEITDPAICETVRATLADPDVAIVGAVGASGARGLAWWRGTVSGGPVSVRYSDKGAGILESYTWGAPEGSTFLPPQRVDVVDGSILALSPWAVEHLRFDESLVYDFGQDVDLCLQAGAAGRAVATAHLGIRIHRELDVIADEDTAGWVESHIVLSRKWDAGPDEDPSSHAWRVRARRAEAERDAARAFAQGLFLTADAQSARLREQLRDIEDSFAWHLTEPLREVNLSRRKRRAAKS